MSADGGGAASAGGLQFDKVDRATPEARACPACRRPIVDEYFQLARTVICGACARGLAGGTAGRGSLPRAALFGAGAAVLGTIVWFAITKLTDHEFGLLAVGVGLAVGIAVRKGGRGLGGWRYQTLAIVLTYVSITASYIPMVIKGLVEAQQKKTDTAAADAPSPSPSSPPSASAAADAPPAPAPAKEKAGAGAVALAFLVIFGIALAAPFLAGASNFMGILIVGFALYEAWKINRRVPLAGPFRLTAAVASPALAVDPGVLPPGVPPAVT